MKTTNYRLQTELENLTPAKKEWFKNYLKELLESDKPYYVKTDYIALSFLELDNKINYLAEEIKQLGAIRKRLQEAKALALEITAQTLKEYGIDRMEGTVVSSITVTPSKKRLKEHLFIKDPNKIMELGYVTFSVDEKALKEALHTQEGMQELDAFVELSVEEEYIPERLKINKKRNQSQQQYSKDRKLLEVA